jgi:hypothetical protein
MDKTIIEKAKAYAAHQKISLSGMIESYLRFLVLSGENANPSNGENLSISSFVKSMSTGKHLPANLDYKSEFTNHLLEKYK